jgi:hypothetical protein
MLAHRSLPTADTEPDRQRLLVGAGSDRGFVQWRPEHAGPGDVVVVAELEEQVEFLAQHGVVVARRPARGTAQTGR